MAKFELSKPAVLASVSYLIMAFVILLPLNQGKCDPKDPECYTFSKRIMTVIMMLIPIGLSIYSINCMMVGKCSVWSWVNSIFIAIWVLLFLVATVLSLDART
jgi:hypothetical protein